MRRRARALGFGAAALVCAALAASLAGRYRDGVEAQLGELRPVLVAREDLAGHRPLRPRELEQLVEVRRVPARFAPADALSDPVQVLGRALRASLPAGAYLTGSLLRAQGPPPRRPGGPGAGREAVEVEVAGAGALASSGNPVGSRFDVVATGEPIAGGGGGRTSVVARDVELLALLEAGGSSDSLEAAPPTWLATVAARRDEALRLIQAHNYAREIRLIGAG